MRGMRSFFLVYTTAYTWSPPRRIIRDTGLVRTTSRPRNSSQKRRVASRSFEPTVPCEMNFVLSTDRVIALLQLDSRFADDLPPHPIVGAHALGERRLRAAERLGADLEQPLSRLGLLDRRLELLVQQAHDLGTRVFRREDPEPGAHFPARQPRLSGGR